MEHISGMLALIGILSLVCQWLGWKLKLPAILPLLVCGLLLGPGFGFLKPDELFGPLLFPIISLGVAIILFEGALTLNFEEIKNHGRMVTHLVTVGVLITLMCISCAVFFLLDFSWHLSLLFGALVVVTGLTVIVPMLRTIKPVTKLANILRWEGIVIDPIGALLAVLVYEYITAVSNPTSHVMTSFGLTIVIGFSMGVMAGFVIGLALRTHVFPHYLKNTAVLTVMLGVFVCSNIFQEESGLLTVTIMGIVLANMKNIDIEDIIEFKETLTVLLISALFILLAARLDSDALFSLGIEGVGVLCVVLLVARPMSVWISGINTSLNTQDKLFLSWVAPRGIVAAAISSLFAIKLNAQGVENADKIVPLVFLIIIGTVVIQSLTAGIWAKTLGVKKGASQGLLIFGANKFSRELALILLKKDIPVVLADTNWDSIRIARMANIPTYFGNPISEHASHYLDLSGIGRLLVLSPYRQLNPLVTFHFQDIFGKDKVFGLNNTEQSAKRHQLSISYQRRLNLFSDSLSYAKIASFMAKGSLLKVTNITSDYRIDEFSAQNNGLAIPLMYMNHDGKLKIIEAEHQGALPIDIELIYLLPKNDVIEGKSSKI